MGSFLIPKDAENLTAETKDRLTRSFLSAALDDAIKVVQGNGSRRSRFSPILTHITAKKLEATLKDMNDGDHLYVLDPVIRPIPVSRAKLWCAKGQRKRLARAND